MASRTTNYSEIQRDEIEALRSIYMEDFEEQEAKTGAWKKAMDSSFKINLRALLGGEEKVALTLSVSLPPTYPKSLPRLQLQFDEDLRPEAREQAKDVVNTKPRTLLGSEMVFELATSLQEILDNTITMSSQDVPTLDEERAARESADRLKAQQIEDEKRQKATQAELEEEQLLLHLVRKRRSQSTRRHIGIDNPSEQQESEEIVKGGMRFEQTSIIRNPHNGKMMSITTVYQRTQYRRGPASEVVTVQPWKDNEGEVPNGEAPFLVLKQSSIRSSGDGTKLAIQNLESKLDFQIHLKPHQSILKPLNFHIERESDLDSTNRDFTWTVTILMELASRQSLRETLDIVDKLDVKIVRAWSIRLIEGIQYYHQHGSAHGSLHLGNILLDQGETERADRKNTIPKLSDGGYQYYLYMLSKSRPKYFPISWTAPETVNESLSEALPATDIWDFGCVFLQMAFGLGVLSEHESPKSLLEELHLTNSLKALLSQVFQNDAKNRPSAWDLLHYEFFRNDDELVEGLPSGHAVSERTSNPISVAAQHHHFRHESVGSSQMSRYTKDFVEDGRLGRGGFGEVFLARNKVDGQPYAIKKVKARSRAALDPVLSEVTVLSRLNHPNVVRYFAAWIDDGVANLPNQAYQSGYETTSSYPSMRNPTSRVLPTSSRGLDFISSAGVQVVFGDDGQDNSPGDTFDGELSEESTEDEENSEDDEAQENSNNSESGHNPGEEISRRVSIGDLNAPANWTILYIQMEYCKPETLRDLINSGLQSNPTEIWRLFRQIVQGLAHIHAASIVHRDLKPENIFIDSGGDVRIGDFGLARPGDYRTNVSSAHVGTKEVFGSFTKDVGTASYVAPEVRSAGSGKYNEKADMFSLGVILLEMNVPFATGMERAENLEKLQRENHTLPPALDNEQKATQGKIFMSLTQHKPSQRPSSLELLHNGQIPVEDENESLRMARRLLTDPTSHYRSHFIGCLFAERRAGGDVPHSIIDPMQAVTLLEDVRAMSRSLPESLDLQAIVRGMLTAIFHQHGAVERTDSPALFPYNTAYPSTDVVQLLYPTGKVMQLPYDLILPNALLLAQQSRPERKTFIFDNVYRVDHLREPKIFGEANFDIVSGNSVNLALQEAEVLKVIDEILDAFPSLTSVQMCYHINHAELLDAILQFCDIELSKWVAVKETISKLHTGDWTWKKVRHELRGPSIAVAATSLDELELFDFRDSWDKAIPRLRSILKDTTELESTFAHMHDVTIYLNRLNVKRKSYINPLSSYNEKFYRGNLLFQCLYDQKKRSVLAAGGRYDQLIRNHQPVITRKYRVHAVGLQLAWTGICADMAMYLKRISKSKAKRRPPNLTNTAWNSRRCDVLVDSFDQDLLRSTGVEILHEIWSNGMSAELAEDVDTNNPHAKSNDNKEYYSWVILIKSDGLVKIKNTIKKEETEIRLSELTGHLRGEVRERDRTEGRTPKSVLLRQSSQQDSNVLENDREVDIKVLVSQNKSKKVNRKTIVEEAQQHKQEYLLSCADSPIVAIETKDDIFDGIVDTRLSDPESWKKFIQSAPPSERQYLGQLQTLLKGMAKDVPKDGTPGSVNVVIYNFRTKVCISYYIGKSTGW